MERSDPVRSMVQNISGNAILHLCRRACEGSHFYCDVYAAHQDYQVRIKCKDCAKDMGFKHVLNPGPVSIIYSELRHRLDIYTDEHTDSIACRDEISKQAAAIVAIVPTPTPPPEPTPSPPPDTLTGDSLPFVYDGDCCSEYFSEEA